MKKNSLQPGDIFELKTSRGTFAYFQFILEDREYLGGHLVRCFDHEGESSQKLDLLALVKGKIRFYAYTRVTQGIDMGLWTRKGNIPIETSFVPPSFREPTAGYHLESEGSKKEPKEWRVFQAGSAKTTYVGELTGDHKELPEAGVLPPTAIIEWIETGKHAFMRVR
jgi:hypothetical protein